MLFGGPVFPARAFSTPAFELQGHRPRWLAGPSGALCSAAGGSARAHSQFGAVELVPRQFAQARKFLRGPERNPLSRILNIGSGQAMRIIVPLDSTMQLPLSLAGGLRTTFADVGSSPLPERLAALVRRLGGDRTESSGEERDEGAKSSHIDRRGRR